MHHFTYSLSTAWKTIGLCTVLAQAFVAFGQTPNDIWTHTTGTHTALALHPEQPGRIYVGAQDGFVMTSADSGRTWSGSTLHAPSAFAAVSGLAPLGGDTVFATAGLAQSLVWRSTDAGETWTALQAGIALGSDVAARRIRPGAVLLSSTSLTRDGGLTLDTLDVPGRVAPDGAGGLIRVVPNSTTITTAFSTYRSEDLGKTWTLVADNVALGANTFLRDGYRLEACDADRLAVVVERQRTLLLSNDGGRTWQVSEPYRDQTAAVAWLSDTEVVAYSDGDDVARSSDNGASWTAAPELTVDRTFIGTQVLASTHADGRLFFASQYALFSLAPGATEFTEHLFRRAPWTSRGLAAFDANRVFVFGRDANNNQGSILWNSLDGGITWQRGGVGPDGSLTPRLSTSSGDYATFRGNILRSTDGGATYTPVFEDSGFGRTIGGMQRLGKSGLLAFRSAGTLVSFDEGDTWEIRGGFPAATQGNASFVSLDEGTWLQAEGSGNNFTLTITRDTGRTIERLVDPERSGRTVGRLVAADGRLFLTPSWRSDDGGLTWVDLSELDGFSTNRHRAVTFRTPTEGFFADDPTGSAATYTVDGGLTWTETGNPRLEEFVYVDSTTGWATGNDFYARLTPGNWPVVALPLNGVSSAQGLPPHVSLAVWPNPVGTGHPVQLPSLQAGTSLELRNASGAMVEVLTVTDRAVQLPPHLQPGLYLLRTQEGKVARLLVR